MIRRAVLVVLWLLAALNFSAFESWPFSVSEAFFGMHMHNSSGSINGPTIPFKTWRLWDCYVTWKDLEPSKGNYDFTRLDQYVAYAQSHHVQLTLSLAFSPTWASARPTEASVYGNDGAAAEPADFQDWRDYVTTVANRYNDKIFYYEIWNEPNISLQYSGTEDQLIELTKEAYQIVKQINPNNKIIMPSCVTASSTSGLTYFDDLIVKGIAQWVDVIGYHFYTLTAPDVMNMPEMMIPDVTHVKNKLTSAGITKELWNTESGWWIRNEAKGYTGPKYISYDLAGRYIARSILLQIGSGIARWNFYAWDDTEMGLLETINPPVVKSSAEAYKTMYLWLAGRELVNYQKDGNNTWRVDLQDGATTLGTYMWNPITDAPYAFAQGTYNTAVDIYNHATFIGNDTSITITSSPILLLYQPVPTATTTPTSTPTVTPTPTATVSPTVTATPDKTAMPTATAGTGSPAIFKLVYPNPAGEKAVFSFQTSDPEKIGLNLYNLSGQLISQVVDTVTPSQGQLVWHTNDVPPGVYFYYVFKYDDKKKITSGKIAVRK